MDKKLTLLDKINTYLVSMQSLKVKDKLIFYRLLSTMINAWVSLSRAIKVLEEQEKNIVLKNILSTFLEKLKSWKKLSECLELYPKSFWRAEVWIIKSWEKTWRLNEVLIDLADQIEKVDSINWKLKWALMYPSFIIVVVIWVITIMMVVVVPKLIEIFDDKSNLPASTQVLISISNFMVNYWFLLFMFFAIVFIWITLWKKTPTWHYMFDKILLKIPIMWEVLQKIILSKFSRVFANMISSWVSMVESLKISSDVVWNEVYRQKILLLATDVKSWIRVHESLEWSPLFPPMMVQMIKVWEDTATLDRTIIKIADYYDEQVDNTIRTLNKLLEPFIIVFLAIVVWFIAMAIMQPIMNLADTVSSK